jgi:hypothetical protein
MTKVRSEYGGAREALRKARRGSSFDIFLSHSLRDAELVLGIREILEHSGKTVYIDWVDDPQLDRTSVTAATADRLRTRMRQCRSLVYASTAAATVSKWMPWELGYFDGLRGAEAVAVMPLVDYNGQTVGQEYVDLYPKIERPITGHGAPLVVRSVRGQRQQKSIDALVGSRGGMAWH